jgi:hypothetical protein
MPIHSGSSSVPSTVLVAILLQAVAISLRLGVVESHSRWVCPKPRSSDTGIKGGPCGAFDTDKMANVSTIVIKPGQLVVQWEESITHTGAPFRIALSSDGRDTDSTVSSTCVLLDHIPHNEKSDPVFTKESTYTLYTLTIDIPDVKCDRCSLHLVNPMTDKIDADGAPEGQGCTDPNGSCFSVYHSCTIPLKITGSIPRAQYKCPNRNPSDWPTTWKGDNGANVTATTRGVYRRESGTWKNGFLMDVPARYRRFLDVNALKCPTPALDPVPPPARAPTVAAPTVAAAPVAAGPVAGGRKGLLARLLDFLASLFSFGRN